MSGPHDVMVCRSPPRMKPIMLIVFLLVSTNTVGLHGDSTTGVDYGLKCVNDYLFTVNCSLRIPPSETPDTSYRLTLIKAYEKDNKLDCMLTKNNTDEKYFCSVKTFVPKPDDDYVEILTDTDSYEILLCHDQNGSDTCDKLVAKYKPVKHIKPNAPCCLTVSHKRHFTWMSTYEEFSSSGLIDNLKFELRIYKRGEEQDALPPIYTYTLNYSVSDEKIKSDMKYAAKVRSHPEGHYQGQWSDWSSEVYWETEAAVDDYVVSGLGKVFIPICVLLPLLLILCYAPVIKWRQSAFIPNPAPYFDTLYTDCQGDFKSWVVTQENTADVLKAEETLHIDTLTECEVIEEKKEEQEEEPQPHPQLHRQVTEGSTYSNIPDSGCDASLLGVPYAVSTMTPPSSAGSSFQSLSLSSQPGSPAEGDSGCWLEREPPWYCNEYCTLSAFQQSGPATAEHHGSPPTKPCLSEVIRVEEAITEA